MYRSLNLLTLCFLIAGTYTYNSVCQWPCAWREEPRFVGTDSVWFVDKYGVGIWNNVSRPEGCQFSQSECVERRGSFFVVKHYDQYFCVKNVILCNPSLGYYYQSKDVPYYKPEMFCTLCDVNNMAKLVVTGRYVYKLPGEMIRPITCNIPAGCPRLSYHHIPCPFIEQEVIDSGHNCEKRSY